MKAFFSGYPKLEVSEEEIIPNAQTPELLRRRAVYADFIHAVKPCDVDDLLVSYRARAMVGELGSAQFAALDQDFLAYRRQQLENPDKTVAYEAINQCAMLMAQVLFVDNCVKEGLAALVDNAEWTRLHQWLSHYITQNAAVDPGLEAADFYSLLYMLQTAFDKIFVPDEEIVNYQGQTGAFQIHPSYDDLTAYLTLSNKKIITACDAEKRLCYNLTTGWGDGIDRQTWDQLNRNYYDGGDDHFFSKYYHTTLEKMLPQFGYGRVRLAESLLKDHQEETELQVLEIGAGSGSFTLDLAMAAKRLNSKTDIAYLGVEPSLLKHHFTNNADLKTGGVNLPENWSIPKW